MSVRASITVRVVRVYGADTIYPVCDRAKVFADIAGTTSLTPRTVEQIKKLGFEVTMAPQEAPACLRASG